MRRLTSVFFAFFLLSSIEFAQESIEDENWLKGFKTEADYLEPLVYWDMASFTLDDVGRGKVRLRSVRQFEPQNEWEGVYYANTGIGDNKFIWNDRGGFFSFYFYHTLKSLKFGKVEASSGFLELEFEKLPYSLGDKKAGFKVKLIKVRIGETHFLVPEDRLQDFCERSVGLSSDLDDFGYYWMKQDDVEKSVKGLPVLAVEYRKFLRHPIEAKIIRVGKKVVIPKQESTIPVTLNAGQDKKLKRKMNFFVEDLGEWVQLTHISDKTSAGVIRRDLLTDKERCFDGEGGYGQIIPCKAIEVGMKARTKLSSW